MFVKQKHQKGPVPDLPELSWSSSRPRWLGKARRSDANTQVDRRLQTFAKFNPKVVTSLGVVECRCHDVSVFIIRSICLGTHPRIPGIPRNKRSPVWPNNRSFCGHTTDLLCGHTRDPLCLESALWMGRSSSGGYLGLATVTQADPRGAAMWPRRIRLRWG